MRNKIKRIVSIAICCLIVVMYVVEGLNQNIKASSIQTATKLAYEYPIYPGDAEWAEYDARERVQMLQIPEGILAKLTTRELVEVVAAYPRLSNIFYYDTYEMGYNAVKRSFNGLAELAKRDDATECLIEYYTEIDFSKPVDLKNARQVIQASNHNALEVILAQEDFAGKVSTRRTNELEQVVIENVQDRMLRGDDIFYRRINCYYEALQENKLVREESRALTVNTPRGTSVPVITISNEWTAEEKLNERVGILSEFPDVTILGDATMKYNSHAYAWATRTNVWMNDPSAYWEDGSYVPVGNSVTSYAQKITYPNAGSTGISHTSHSSSNDGSVVWSKWGASCLVEHSVYNCPYGEELVPPYAVTVYRRQ